VIVRYSLVLVIAALDAAEPNAIICADSTTVAPLLYVQEVQGVRPDVKIIAGSPPVRGLPESMNRRWKSCWTNVRFTLSRSNAGTAPLFILAKYPLAEAGVLWRVAKPAPAGAR